MEHTLIGARLLAPLLKHAPQVLAVVRSHHERMDGSGFPDGLRAESIPMHARVVSVVDAFDAMTTNRAYRASRHPADAMEELQRCAGLQFDPDVVMAGERRDQETAAIAVRAALTGQRGFSTLHTNDAGGAIARLSGWGGGG